MNTLVWKVRITVLWVFLAVTMSASMILYFAQPGALEDIMAGKMEGWEVSTGLLTFFSLFWLVPLVMAFLSVALRNVANRWTNVGVGLFFTVFNIVHMMEHLLQGTLDAHHLLLILAMIVVSALIFWHGLRWPKEKT